MVTTASATLPRHEQHHEQKHHLSHYVYEVRDHQGHQQHHHHERQPVAEKWARAHVRVAANILKPSRSIAFGLKERGNPHENDVKTLGSRLGGIDIGAATRTGPIPGLQAGLHLPLQRSA